MWRAQMTMMGSNKHLSRLWQQAYSAAAKVMSHKEAIVVADKAWDAKKRTGAR